MFHDDWWGIPMMWFVWFPILIVLIVVVMRLNDNKGANSTPIDSPMDILKKR